MRKSIEYALAMVSIAAPRALVDGKNLVPGKRKHNSIDPMPHGLDSVAKIVIPVIIKMLLGKYFALELNIFDERIGFDVILVFEENVVLDFHSLRKDRKILYF